MKKLLSFALSSLMIYFVIICSTACGIKAGEMSVAEEVSLANAVFCEIEFENSESVKLKQNGDEIIVSGSIEKMSDIQKNVFGDESVSHVIVLKFLFDKERTIDSFEIRGSKTKVYSTDGSVENYVGSISDLLDNEPGEDAFCKLILSANTKQYTLKATYSDSTISLLTLTIDATLMS